MNIKNCLFASIIILSSSFIFGMDEGQENNKIKPDSKSEMSIDQIAVVILITDLIKEGGHINAQDKEGETSLMKSCIYGFKEMSQALISQGADINIQDKKGRTALMWAVVRGHNETVKFLLTFKTINLDIQDEDLKTALMLASMNGHLEIAKLLINSKANLNLQDDSEQTALIIASLLGRLKIVDLLLKSGADINIKSKKGKNVLNILCFYRDQNLFFNENKKNNEEVIKLLENQRIKNDILLEKLISAINSNDSNIIKEIITQFPFLVDEQGNNALHVAGKLRNKDLFLFILGIKPGLINKKNYINQTALDIYPEMFIHLAINYLKNKMDTKLVSCIICPEKVISPETKLLSCDHNNFFHNDCIKGWLDKRNWCPLCNIKVTKK